MGEWAGGWMDGCVRAWRARGVDGWIGGWMGGRMDGCDAMRCDAM